MYKIWCEWDIGCEHKLFTTEEEAEKYAKGIWTSWMEEEVECTFDEALEDGLVGFEELEVIA